MRNFFFFGMGRYLRRTCRLRQWRGQIFRARFREQRRSGTYVELEREWISGDTVTFTHQMGLTAMEYEGRDAAPNGHDRYALMYGPILMAVTGNLGSDDIPEIRCSARKLSSKLVPEESGKLHFAVEGQSDLRYVPYYEIEKETFCCYPTVSGQD